MNFSKKRIKSQLRCNLCVLLICIFFYCPSVFGEPIIQQHKEVPKGNKLNLVLIHSFPTNSIILKGLSDYLSDYFNVYFIDLPGFVKNKPPLKEVSLGNYVDFVEKELKRTDFNSFWIGGVSFGFLVANSINAGNHIKGILAIEPFWGSDYLNISFAKKTLYKSILNIITFCKLEKTIWQSPLFDLFFFKGTVSPEYTKIIKTEINPRTFFKTAKILIEHDGNHTFQKKPYVLIINKDDQTIKAEEIIKSFNENIKIGIVLHTSAEHFPKDISKKYFQKNIEPSEIKKFVTFTQSF